MAKYAALLTLLLTLPSLAPTEGIELYAGQTPQHALAADFNRDGRMDIAVASTFDDSVTIFHQDESGNLTGVQTLVVGANPFPPSNFPRYLAVADYNNDGAPDITVLCSGNFAFSYEPSIQTLINLGDGTFAALEAGPTTPLFTSEHLPVQFVVGQFSDDSLEDVALVNLAGGTLRILLGNGTGQFTIGPEFPVGTPSDGPHYVAMADLDGDGLSDLVAVTETQCVVLHQSAPGVFDGPIPYALPAGTFRFHAVALDDFNQDGLWDAALADRNGRVLRLLGIGPTGGSIGSDFLEHPSLNGCSDIRGINWDDDWLPEIAVTNLDGNTVTIFGTEGVVHVLATAGEPRRLASADMNGSGRLDLITANEGDEFDPQNPDVNIFLNPGSLDSPGSTTRRDDLPLAGRLGLRLLRPQALGIGSPTRVWAVENNRRAIQEFNPSPNLNANLSARLGDRLEFPFEIGGLSMIDHREGYVLDRWTGELHRFTVAAGLQVTTALAALPGNLGHAGLARDPATGQFYVSDPGAGQILRFDAAGALLSSFPVDPPAGDLAWMPLNSRLYVVHPGAPRVRAYDSNGNQDVAAGFNMQASIFLGEGLAGVGKAANKNELLLMTTHGILMSISLDGSIGDVVSVSPASEVIALTYDPAGDLLYVLGQDAHVSRMRAGTMDGGQLFSLWPAIASDPLFVPGGIAFDSLAGNFIVHDRRTPRFARFSTSNGSFLGFEDHSASLAETAPGGFDLDSATGDLLLRDHLLVKGTTPGAPYPVPQSQMTDLAYRAGSLVVGLPNPGEALVIPTDGMEPPYGVVLPESLQGGGLAFLGDNTILSLGTANASHMTTFDVSPPDLSRVSDWSLY